jgi:transcriptional regulator with XRE-family HTH domain
MYNPEQECKVMIKNLKRLCKEKNISANALAIEAGISTSTMSYIMNGKSKPYVYTVLMICNVLGVTVSELFEDIELDFNNTDMKQMIKNEEELIAIYRSLSVKKRKLLLIFMEMLLDYDEENLSKLG